MEDDFDEISQQNYIKLSETIKKTGYAEGVHAGRESVFQSGFDTGYSEGFKNGFKLGSKSAKSRLETVQHLRIESGVNKPTRGNCILCSEPSLVSQSLSEITTQQRQKMEMKISTKDK